MQKFFKINNIIWAYIIISLFVIINSFLIYKEFFYFGIISVVIGILFLAFIRLDSLVYVIIFLTPLSIPLRYLQQDIENDIILPTEPLILIALFIFFAKLIYERKFDKNILKHPITIAIFVNLIWIFLTSITSTMPLVSFKYFASRIWFLIVFYFLLSQIFNKYENINRYLWLYIIAMIIVILYAIIRQSTYGISNQKAANFVPNPFFNDHTAYGASLAMIYPVILYFFLQKSKSLLYKVLTFLLLLLFTAAIILSYTRATWVSLLAGLAIYLIIKFRIKLRFLLITAAIFLAIVISSWNQIMIKLEKNTTESSDYLLEHIESISNVSTDASNLERINRWSCAIRMFKEKPFFGWGPGTYRFKYAPFQMSYQKTLISTNAGVLGNAHSEYIGPLCEMGFFGTISFVVIIILTLVYGIRLYHRTRDHQTKQIVIAMLIGLITYYIHGIMNNFLDTDKASCLFWGYTATFVAIELYHQKKITGSDEVIKN